MDEIRQMKNYFMNHLDDNSRGEVEVLFFGVFARVYFEILTHLCHGYTEKSRVNIAGH